MELPNAADFLTRQDALQSEASEVLNDLDILTYLGKAGEVVLVGSYPLGLMVWRDIDVYVYCAPLSADRAFTALRPLASHLGVVHLNFDNWRGPNGTPAFPDGYYWGIRYRSAAGCEWKLDLWFLPDDTPRRETALAALMDQHLTPETRRAILILKERWHHLPSYGRCVASIDIYDAVLLHGVRTQAAFARYLRERGKPDDESA